MTGMGLTEAERAAARDLTADFLNQRTRLEARIVTGGLYDIHRIAELVPGLDPGPAVALEDAIAGTEVLVEGREVAPLPAPDVDHYALAPRAMRTHALRRYTVEEAYLSYDFANMGRPEFYVFDRERRLVNGLFFGARPRIEPPVARFDGHAALIDDRFVRFNVCHFLFDKLPRAGLAGVRAADAAILAFDTAYTRHFAALAGVRTLGLAEAAGRRRGTLHVRRLDLLGHGFRQMSHPAERGHPGWTAMLGALRARATGRAGDDAPRRIFLARGRAETRRIVNAPAVEALLGARGFATIDPGALSPPEQARIFARAEVVVGVHGAGLANLLFAPRGAAVVELLPPLCATDAYRCMSLALGRRYRGVVCEDPELGVVPQAGRHHDGTQNRRDVVVPVEALADTLDRLVGAAAAPQPTISMPAKK